jgi:hypothetical protein
LFKDEQGRPGDSRPGSTFPDLLFRAPSKRLVAFNDVDVDAKGNITQREVDSAARLRRSPVDVYLVPKPPPSQRRKRRHKKTNSEPNESGGR